MNKIEARELRKSMTDAERILWQYLRLKQLNGYKFRRQCPIGSYIADFVCFDKKLIIEVDGSQHAEQRVYDLNRTKWLESQGFIVLRFWNNEVLNEMESVLNKILNVLTPTLILPHKGGGKTKNILLLTFLCLLSVSRPLLANNLAITNARLTSQNTSANTVVIEFDISWDNSWRDSVNYDAVWVFVKHNAAGTTTWNHVTLYSSGTNPSGYSTGSGTGIEIIVPTDKKGAFIQRSSLGSGTLTTTDVQLVWDYGADGYGSSDSTITNGTTQIKIFGIEMTYIPTGSFYVGDGGSGSYGEFEFGSTSNLPPQISSENGISFKAVSAGDWYYNRTPKWPWASGGEFQSGRVFNVSGAFPKGYRAFYLMKYEMSQKQYVDFLNTLTRDQQDTRVDADVSGTENANIYVMSNTTFASERNVIISPSSGNGTSAPITFSIASSGYSNRAMNWLDWVDLLAFADWAALRPITEFEFEKAARGPIYPVDSEYAWGNTTLRSADAVSCPTGVETGTEYNGTASANVVYADGATAGFDWSTTCYDTDNTHTGPARTGFFSTSSSTTRTISGGGYYGNMELSGNVAEMVVTVGSTFGLSFAGTHGDGRLTDLTGATYDGNATNLDWPGIDQTSIDRGVTQVYGSGVAGGGFYSLGLPQLTVSKRVVRTAYIQKLYQGGRLARTAPD